MHWNDVCIVFDTYAQIHFNIQTDAIYFSFFASYFCSCRCWWSRCFLFNLNFMHNSNFSLILTLPVSSELVQEKKCNFFNVIFEWIASNKRMKKKCKSTRCQKYILFHFYIHFQIVNGWMHCMRRRLWLKQGVCIKLIEIRICMFYV